MTTTTTVQTPSTIALITGGNRGLGLATARLLGRGGVTVLIGARDEVQGERAAAQLRGEGILAQAISLDVTSESSVESAADDISARFGRIDILVNNAGVLPEATRPVESPLDLSAFRETFDTNVFGAVTMTKFFLPLLRKSASGRIVNVSSTMGSLSDQSDPRSQYYGQVVPAYQMSKAALNGLTVALAKLLTGTSIKVNSICPGWVRTDLGGAANRAAAPTDAADAAEIVADMALLGSDGPSGQFFDRMGSVAW
ncbi:SDR family oxidoreductase [Antrihabitans stalagmiti]|uniref:SDR family oxidoreductase n=1 Tax=Antrihabitans stalagmiti TaxID=2799499 RepID=UPI001F25F4F1|nr:SDR family oxidoreductase [Antrihabitans stalagmiti]